MKHLKRGELARRSGLGVETLRYYERRGLIPEPPRSMSNYRLYPPETVQRLEFVKGARALGFSLAEIKDLLALRAGPRTRAASVRKRVEAKIAEIDEKIRGLASVREALAGLVRECPGRGPAAACPILGSLDGRKEKRR